MRPRESKWANFVRPKWRPCPGPFPSSKRKPNRDVEGQCGKFLAEESNRRSLRNLVLTERFRFAYFGWWVLGNLALLACCFSLAVAIVLITPPQLFPGSPVRAILLLASGVIAVAGLLVLFGALSAHRIAGAHLKLESIFNKVAEGDFSTRLHFRTADNLDDVGIAFNRMMDSIDEGVKPEARESEPEQEAERPRRSLKSWRLTSKHHANYTGIWLITTLGILFLTQRCAVTTEALAVLSTQSGVMLARFAQVVNTAVLLLFPATIYFAFREAHRIAGVHVKLKRTFDRIREGEREIELKFRANDKLEPLEGAFVGLMASIVELESKEKEPEEPLAVTPQATGSE